MSNNSTTGITSDKPGFLAEVCPHYPCPPDDELLLPILPSFFQKIESADIGSKAFLRELLEPAVWDPIPPFEKGRIGEIVADLVAAKELPLRRVSPYGVRPAIYEILENEGE